jgi:hypothetical protein
MEHSSTMAVCHRRETCWYKLLPHPILESKCSFFRCLTRIEEVGLVENPVGSRFNFSRGLEKSHAGF